MSGSRLPHLDPTYPSLKAPPLRVTAWAERGVMGCSFPAPRPPPLHASPPPSTLTAWAERGVMGCSSSSTCSSNNAKDGTVKGDEDGQSGRRAKGQHTSHTAEGRKWRESQGPAQNP